MIEGIADIAPMPQPQTTPPPEPLIAETGVLNDPVRDPSTGEIRLGDVLFLDPRQLDALGGELDVVALAGDDYGGPIIVTGWWGGWGSSGGGGDGGYNGWDTNQNEGGNNYDPPPDPPPGDLNCLSAAEIAAMTAAEREAYDVALEAAEISREIMSKPDRDYTEYGSIIFRDTSGVITHTPITPGGPTFANLSTAGMVNHGQMLGIVHSHTASQFISALPEFKLFPTPDSAAPRGEGDWWVFDWNAVEMINSLKSNYGYTEEAAIARALHLRQFVLGPTAGPGANQYELRGYSALDRDTVTLGQKISMNLGLCSG